MLHGVISRLICPEQPLSSRGLGFELQSCDGDTEKVQKALAQGLICNTVRFESTIYSATEKHHNGTDVYRLIHNAAPGNYSAISFKSISDVSLLSLIDLLLGSIPLKVLNKGRHRV